MTTETSQTARGIFLVIFVLIGVIFHKSFNYTLLLCYM